MRAGAAVLLLIANVAAAEDAGVIRAITVEGNRRTATSYIVRELGVSRGDPFDPGSLPMLEQRLMNLRLFKQVQVEAREEDGEGGVLLHVAVEERWTLIPFPLVGASRGTAGVGLFLLESNLFGRGKQLGAGVTVSTRGTSASLTYRDPSVAGTPLLFSADGAHVDVTRVQDAGTSSRYEFQDRRWEYGVGLGWRLTRELAVRGGYFGILADPGSTGGYAPPPSAAPVRGLAGEVELRSEDYHLYYVRGLSGRVRYRQGVSWLASARELRQASATVTWSMRAVADHALSLTASFDSSRGDPIVDALRLGGRPGSRGFTFGGLWAETAGTFTAEYQVPIWRRPWGTVTGAAFCDAGATRWKGEPTSYLAPGLGMRLYLRQLAVPAIGLDVAQATGQSSPAVSFVAGFRY
jgi:outer membrane protein assembly factor BamA